jgi:hypothetical protein
MDETDIIKLGEGESGMVIILERPPSGVSNVSKTVMCEFPNDVADRLRMLISELKIMIGKQ